jgi:hypothetical protein
MNTNFIDMTDRRFGRWTVVRPGERDRSGVRRWVCRCDCGTVKETSPQETLDQLRLRPGRTDGDQADEARPQGLPRVQHLVQHALQVP